MSWQLMYYKIGIYIQKINHNAFGKRQALITLIFVATLGLFIRSRAADVFKTSIYL